MANDRNYSIDTFKFFAAFAVVGIHTQPFMNLDKSIYYNIYFILRVLFSFAVPFFFMSSGYLLCRGINNTEYKEKYILKYLKRILNILIITLSCYIIFNLGKFLLSSNPIGNTKNLFTSIFNIKNIYYGIEEGAMFHLWYLFSLIYVIILIYFFRKNIKQLFIISIVMHLFGNLIQIYNININVRDALFYGLFYTMLGYYIYDNKVYLYNKIKEISKINLIFVLIGSNIVQILEAYIFSGRTYYFSTIIVSIIVFLIIIKDKEILKDTLINNIGKQSLGIYLIHVMILDTLYLFIVKLNLQYLTLTLAWHIIITPAIFMMSWVSYIIIIRMSYQFNVILRDMIWNYKENKEM